MVLECSAVEQWFLDSGLRQDLGILDMNGIRATYRAVQTPPPFCLGGPPVFLPLATGAKMWHQSACPECDAAFETLRQLVVHRHPPGIVT